MLGPSRLRRHQRRAVSRRAAAKEFEKENASNVNAEEATGNAEIVEPEQEAEKDPTSSERFDVMKEKIQNLEKENENLRQSIKIVEANLLKEGEEYRNVIAVPGYVT